MKENILKKFSNLAVRERKKQIKVGVVAGGISSEREVSLSTGRGIYEALLNLGYNVEFLDFDGNVSALMKKINIAFIALHGKYGEDGTVQGLFELLRIPYTGSGVLASAAAMDKIFSKKIFQFENVPTPVFLTFESAETGQIDEIKAEAYKKIGYPLIVKPSRGGSTIGVTVVQEEKLLDKAIKTAFLQDDKILIEKFISGKLLTVGIIGKNATALPLIEIRPKSGFYDYESKYTAGMTDYLVPAPVSKLLAEKISAFALKSHNLLGCSGISRVDLILDRDNGINILEVNTIPGMTPTSLVPKAAAACGISFENLAEIILDCASLKL